MLATAALSATSCSDGKSSEPAAVAPSATGTLDLSGLSVSVNTTALGSDPVNVEASRADATVDVSRFLVDITKADGSAVASWAYADKPSMLELPAGSYSLAVASHHDAEPSFDRPLYSAARNFDIQLGTVNYLGAVECRLASVKVSVVMSDELLAAVDASATAVKVSVGTGSLSFRAGEQRSGYFHSGASLVAEFAGSIGGNAVSVVKAISSVTPGHHYIINYTARTPQGGFVDPRSIGLDVSVTDVNLGFSLDVEEPVLDSSDRPGGNQGGSEPDPGPEPGGEITFSSSQLSFTDVNPTSVAEAVVQIHASEGIASLEVEIISEHLTDDFLHEVGLASAFDLAAPGSLEPALAGLGFPTGAQVSGRTDVTFNITQFIPLLNIYPGTHSFRITVTDTAGASDSRTLTFIAQ